MKTNLILELSKLDLGVYYETGVVYLCVCVCVCACHKFDCI